jgi:hypothetical protein
LHSQVLGNDRQDVGVLGDSPYFPRRISRGGSGASRVVLCIQEPPRRTRPPGPRGRTPWGWSVREPPARAGGLGVRWVWRFMPGKIWRAGHRRNEATGWRRRSRLRQPRRVRLWAVFQRISAHEPPPENRGRRLAFPGYEARKGHQQRYSPLNRLFSLFSRDMRLWGHAGQDAR